MSRESSLNQIESERVAIEQQVLAERGPDEVLAAPNPGVIVVPAEAPANFPLGLSGSLTKLVDGSDYLIAGTNITLLTGANGSITISSAGGVSAGGNDTEVQYNDGGSSLAGSSNFTYDSSTSTLRVTNLSGSLTRLANGDDFLKAGPGILISTGANGSVTLSSVLPGDASWTSYTPTIYATETAPTLPSSHNLHGRYVVQGKMMTLMFNFSGASSAGSSAGSGAYAVSIPPGFAINTSIAPTGSYPSYLDGAPLAVASLTADLAGAGGAWAVIPSSTTTLALVGQNPSSSSQPLVWGSDNFYIGQSEEYRVSFIATIPVV